ncbi:hypothetical protein BH10CYA1_BH10CYA1_57010 [soil metagenome]
MSKQPGESQIGIQSGAHDLTKEESVPSALWQSAYEHKIAVGLGVAALTGASLYLTKGRIANLFAPRSQEVLLVEAAPFIGKAMKESLESVGHRVTWITEIDKLKPLTGLTEDGTAVSLKLNRFHTAFLDPNHVTEKAMSFDQLAPFFHRGNVRTFGTSVMSGTNKEMLASGIDIAANKTTVLTALVGKTLDLQQAVRAPVKTQAILSTLEGNINSAELANIRAKTNELVMKFMLN